MGNGGREGEGDADLDKKSLILLEPLKSQCIQERLSTGRETEDISVLTPTLRWLRGVSGVLTHLPVWAALLCRGFIDDHSDKALY